MYVDMVDIKLCSVHGALLLVNYSWETANVTRVLIMILQDTGTRRIVYDSEVLEFNSKQPSRISRDQKNWYGIG